MTPEQMALVQTSFAHILPVADTTATLFYKRLFMLNPVLRTMFPSDMRAQERKLIQMMSVVVNSLNRLETLIPTVQVLGRRHSGYGVTDADYELVGAVLLWTLQHALREQWTPSIEAAWTAAYVLLAETMKTACTEYVLN